MPCANADDAAKANSAAKVMEVARFIEYLAWVAPPERRTRSV
ncbi:hypothetical protein C7S16_4227 [Burkholderia thailandensis]|uniref:Uncharacterized protein n=1 Tax=Burkholderia thailandensis TaxID=57975 RepID=A0AAW9CRC0_BURTH|nr:hypothetical protein [Burkholderia thailandensis]MDW9252166.1 hypothetical protein [Burkholderia thailandensis]